MSLDIPELSKQFKDKYIISMGKKNNLERQGIKQIYKRLEIITINEKKGGKDICKN